MIDLLRQLYGRHEWKPARFQLTFPGFRIVLPDVLSINVGDDMEGVAFEFAPVVVAHKETWLPDWVTNGLLRWNIGSVVIRLPWGFVVKDENGAVLLRVGA